MIISRLYRYVYLEPTGVSAPRAYLRLHHAGLVGRADIGTGAGEGYMPDSTLPSQNWTPMSRIGYERVCEAPIRRVPNLPAAGFDAIINRTLTLTEIVRLGVLAEDELADFRIYAVVREPIDRALHLYFRAVERRGWNREDKAAFEDWAKNDNMVHHLWKNQHHWHEFNGRRIVTPVRHDRFDQDVAKMIADLGGTDTGFPGPGPEPPTPLWFTRDGLSDELRTILAERYARDVELWENTP